MRAVGPPFRRMPAATPLASGFAPAARPASSEGAGRVDANTS
ncbi:hypothetical protein [Actinoplanes sp. NPDC020271]